jgi:hypothetical protein
VTTYRGPLWVIVDDTEREVEAICTVRYSDVPTPELSNSLEKTMLAPDRWDGSLNGPVEWSQLRAKREPIALRGPRGRTGEAVLISVSGSTAEIAGSGEPPFDWKQF